MAGLIDNPDFLDGLDGWHRPNGYKAIDPNLGVIISTSAAYAIAAGVDDWLRENGEKPVILVGDTTLSDKEIEQRLRDAGVLVTILDDRIDLLPPRREMFFPVMPPVRDRSYLDHDPTKDHRRRSRRIASPQGRCHKRVR